MKIDYPELEGKEVLYNYKEIIITAKVSGCNYHIGISIEDSNGYLLCLNGKYSPLYNDFKNHLPRYIYRKLFHLLIKQIKNGKIYPEILINMTTENSQGIPTAKDCPFAQ